MKIRYQGKETETGALTVAMFLEEKDIVANEAVIELDGEIVAADAATETTLRGCPPRDGRALSRPRQSLGG